jgi:glucosamine-6-phosphate deaminase
MEIVIAPSPEHCSAVVADIITAAIRAGANTLGLATGTSPVGVYAELARRHRQEGLSFAGLQAFLLDEYVGLAPDHPQSYARTIRTELIDQVDLDPARVHGPEATADDVFQAAEDYDRAVTEQGPVDVQILGIGGNGHIGFNEPASSLTSRTRVKTLTEQTRRDNSRFFDTLDDVPRHVITQGLGTISEAEHLVLIACGSHKAAAIAAAVEGPLAAVCPASVLQLHPHVTVVIDNAAAEHLRYGEFYRYTMKFKPTQQRY